MAGQHRASATAQVIAHEGAHHVHAIGVERREGLVENPHRRVPRQLIGRVSSLDWLVSASLIPVSYAIVGPVSQAVGVRATLLVAGSVGAAVYLLLPVLVPRVRAVESEPEPDRVASAGQA